MSKREIGLLQLKARKSFIGYHTRKYDDLLLNMTPNELISLKDILATANSSDRRSKYIKCCSMFKQFKVHVSIWRYNIETLYSMPNTVTKERMILRYGESEGTRRWDVYRDKQAVTNSFEYKNKHHGMSRSEYDNYNASRSVTLENLIKRHGYIKGRIMFKDYCTKQAYAGSSLQYFIDKYGWEGGNLEFNRINKLKAPSLENFKRIHGDVVGILRYESFIQKVSAPYSIASQELFHEIAQHITANDISHMYYAKHNNEFGMMTENGYLKYDFVLTNIKLCIEYNGDHYHANPLIYKDGDIVTAKRGSPQPVSEIWERDKIKNNIIKSRGYKLFIVWDSEYKDNPKKVINDCLNEIRRCRDE